MSEFTAKITAELDTSKIEQQINGLNGKKVKLDVDTGNTQKNINNVSSSIKSATKTASSFGDTLKKSFNIGAAATITREGFQLIRTAANNAVEAIKDLDGAIVDLQMATGKSYDQVSKLVGNYNEMAKALGATTTQVTEAADSWLRQGNSLSETNTLIRDSMILSKVGQLDSAAATQYLTSSMKGYKVAAEDALSIVDKLTAVDLESATNAGGLAEAMSEVAVTASNAGISMDKLLGYLAATGEVTQESMSTIGTSFKTIFTRMSDIKSGKLELIDEDGTTEILSDVEQTLANVGIDLRATVTEFNDADEVLDNLAGKWKTLNSVQQAALAKAFAGTRQQNRFRVLMDNYDNAKKYMEVAANSAGTAESKFSAYLDSLEAKLNSLQAAFESLVFNSSMTELYSGIVEASTAVLEFLDNTKLLQGALAGLATAGAVEGLKALISGIQNSATQMSNFGNALTLLSSGSQVMGDDFQDLLLMTENLSKSQLKAVLSSEALSTEQRIAILTSQGMTTAQAEAALSSMGLATAEGAATASTVTLASAVKGLWATLMANPLLLIVAAVTAGTMAISALAGAAREASEAADEYKTKSMEEAQAAQEEIQTLDELISKYKELAESDTQDIGTREEIKSIQSQITDLVGSQADNLDLVNGKLDEEIDKLNQIRKEEADKAVDKATTAYHAAKDSHDKAIGQDSALWFDGYAYVSDDWWSNEDDVIDILQQNGFSNNVQKGGVFNSHTFIMDTMDENMNMLEGATEKAELLKRMIAVIEENYPDYASSDIWNELSNQAEAYEQYAEDMKKTARNLADLEVVSATYDESISKMNVDSLENYSNYRDKLIELVKNSPNLSEAISSGDLTDEDLAGQVDNYLATVPKFSDYYNQFSDLEEWKKKIADVKKAFSDSDWVQDASWSIAEQRINDFNDWFDNLSDEDKEIVYNISCNTDTAKFNLEDWKNALENYSAYTEQTAEEISNNLTKAMESSKSLISNISSVQDALSSQATGKSISIEDFNSNELADYRSALEYTNGTMQLNADKVNEIVKAKADEQIALNNTNKAMAQSKYLENARQIEEYRAQLRDASLTNADARNQIQNNIDSLLEENSAIADTCAQYDLLSASLQEATGAYQHWLNAQSSSDYGDMAEDAVSAIQRIRDTYDSESDIFGDYGSKKFDAAVDFIIPDSVSPDDLSAIESYMDDFKKYLTFDDDGNTTGLNIDKFLSDSVEAGLMSYSEDDGFKVLGGKKMEDFAEGLNLSSGVVQAFFDELQLKGGEFDWGDEAVKTIGDLAIEANEAAEALRNVDGNSSLKIKMDVSDLATTEEQCKALDDAIAEMDKVKAKPGVDTTEIDNANAVIQYCLMQKQLLTQPDVMRVDTSKVEGDIGNALALLQEFQNAQNNLEIKQKIGADTSEAQAEVDSLTTQIQGISPDIKAKLSLDTTSTDSIKTSIAGLSAETINVKANVDASAISGYSPESKTCDVIYNPKTDALPQSFDSINRTVNYLADTSGLPKSFSTITRYVNYVKTGDVSVNGTAHASGTAKAGGDWGTAPGGKTLVGELGQEIVVDPRTGKWYTVGDNGAEFRDIPAGAIVFNHIQSKSLLENGYVAGRASALVSGTAMVTGGYKPYKPNSGGGSSSNSGGSSSSSSSKSSSSSGGSSSSSSSTKEDEPKKVDWIEIAIERIERAINKLKKTAESTYKSLKTRSAAASKEISKVNEELSLQKKAYDRYIQEANSVGLSSDLAAKVRDGTIDINEYDSETQELISDYQEWYEKALDCADAIDDLHESLASLYEDNFNNIQTDFDNQLSLLEHLSNTYETGMDKLEAQGRLGSTEYYAAMNDVEKKNLKTLNNELNSLTQSFSDAMASGEIEEYSEAWYAMQQSINDTKEAIDEATLSILENEKAMRELEWSYFDYIQDRISQITQESNFLIDLMSNSNLYEDNGQLNDNGMATMGLRAQNYNVYMAQADQYAQEILKLDEEIAKDPYNTDLIERREELLGLQQDSILAAEDEKQAIVDLVREGINIELQALQDLIDAYTDSLDSAKDLYEYQKKIEEQTTDIANLQKQLSAYENDTSEENRARVQQIKVDLAEAQEKLAETEYDQFVTETKKLLDDLYDKYEEILNERLDNVDALLSDMIDAVNTNSASISETLITESDKVGYTMTEGMKSIWSNDGAASAIVAKYGDNFSGQLTTVNQVLSGISANVAKMVAESDQEAQETVETTTPTTAPSTPSTPSTPSKPPTTPTTNTKFNEDVKRGVAAAIWIYGASKSGWGNDPDRKKRLTAKFGASNAAAVQSYINAHGSNGDLYKYWTSTGKNNLSKYYYSAFKTGGLADYTGFAWMDGTPNKPELVLNAKDTENFIGLRDVLRDMSQDTLSINNPNYSGFDSSKLSGLTDISGILAGISVRNGDAGNSIGEINITIPIDHVENYDDFVNQLRQDKKFEQLIQSMTVDRLTGGSSLAKNKYKW